MKTSIPKKLLQSKLVRLKLKCLSEHGEMLYAHCDASYMRERAKEEIMRGGDLNLACALILLAEVKDGSKNSA